MARPHRVFVSHSSRDSDVAMEICKAIEARGVRCVIAPRDIDPGVEYPEWIGREIHYATGYVFVVSQNSLKSRTCFAETELAFNNEGSDIFPICIDTTRKEDLDFKWRQFLSVRQWVDAAGAARAGGIRRLSGTVARKLLGKKVRRPKIDAQSVLGLGKDEAYFRTLWAQMDARGMAVSWLWEAAIAGPFWPYARGLKVLGHAAIGGLALMTFIAGMAGGLQQAALMLLVGWIAMALLFALFGATLLRKDVSSRPAGLSRRLGPIPNLVGAGLLAAAMFLPSLGSSPDPGPAHDGADNSNLSAAASVASNSGEPQAADAVVAGSQRVSGDKRSWREERAREAQRLRDMQIGYLLGRVDEHVRHSEGTSETAAEGAAAE